MKFFIIIENIINGTASELDRNMFSGAVLAIGNIIISLISYPLFLNYIGVELYGLWATLSFVIMLSSIGGLGIDSAITKFVAEEYCRNNIIEIRRLLSAALLFSLLFGFVIFIAIFLCRNNFIELLNAPEHYQKLLLSLFPSVVLLSILIYISEIIGGVLRGVGRVDLVNYYFLGTRVIGVGLSVIMFKNHITIWGLFYGQFISYIVFGLLCYTALIVKLKVCPLAFSGLSFNKMIVIARFCITITGAKLVSMLLIPFNKIMIARYVDLSAVTYFEIANRVVYQLRSVFDNSTKAIMPAISEAYSLEESKVRIKGIISTANKMILYFGLPSFVAVAIFAPELLFIWLGDNYVSEISDATKIVLAGQLVNLLALPAYYCFMGINMVQNCFYNHLIQAVLNVLIVLYISLAGYGSLNSISGIYSISVAFSAFVLIITFLNSKKALQI